MARSAEHAAIEAKLAAGIEAMGQGQVAEARAFLEAGYRIGPKHPGIRNTLGVLRLETGDAAGAITLLEPLVREIPGAAGIRINLGNALVAAGRSAEAIPVLSTATQLERRSVPAWYGYGRALQLAGRPVEAAEAYRRAVTLDPSHVEARANLVAALAFADAFQEAVSEAREVLARAPQHANAHFNRAVALLSQGHWSDGWAAYEWRQQTTLLARQRRTSTQPQWDGTVPLSGRTLLVQAEQGFGDTLQFVRYLPALRHAGAFVVLQCPQPLVALLELAGLADQVIAFDEAPPPHDVQLSLPSVPHRLRLHTDAEVMGQGRSYLRPPAVTEAFSLADTSGLRVGLVWAGSPTHVNDMHRSCGWQALAPLLTIPGISWVSLQEGAEAASHPHPEGIELHRLGERVTTFADTAQVIAQLDLVISIDSAVAHLAGALGRRCWLLLPRIGRDWRWAAEREGARWYQSVRSYRQERAGRWAEPIAAIRRALVHATATGFTDDLPPVAEFRPEPG